MSTKCIRSWQRLFQIWVAFFAATAVMPASAQWRCEDGTPCPVDCPMLTGRFVRPEPQTETPAAPKCSQCPEDPLHGTVVRQKPLCSSGKCTVSAEDRPPAAPTPQMVPTAAPAVLPSPSVAEPQHPLVVCGYPINRGPPRFCSVPLLNPTLRAPPCDGLMF
jgi:hypothetical protein